MKILVTGKGGRAGSWKIRADQLGAAIGGDVHAMAGPQDCARADLVVVVKRTPPAVIQAIRRSRKPWVYDIVDGWPQPCAWDREQAIAWLRRHLAELKPTAVVFGTPEMQEDAAFRGPSMVLPHHSWQRYVEREPEVRDTLQVLGYEGSAQYLGKWLAPLAAECASRGIRLAINEDMAQADAGIALRDGGGYPAEAWKPGTKLTNLHALGIPALCSREAGYRSVASGREFWIDRPVDIATALDALADVQLRQAICADARAAMRPLSEVAATYQGWLRTLA